MLIKLGAPPRLMQHAALEKAVVEGAAGRAGQSFWEFFVPLDTCFEDVAAGGAGRLARSV